MILLHLTYTWSFVIKNIVTQAEEAFIGKDFLRAASFYAKVVYLSPITLTMPHLLTHLLGINFKGPTLGCLLRAQLEYIYLGLLELALAKKTHHTYIILLLSFG